MMQTQSVTQEAGALIERLADKLAVPAAKLWSVLVLQARVEAIANVVLIGLYLAGLFVIWRVLFPKLRAWRLEDNSSISDRDIGWVGFQAGAVLFTIGFGIASTIALNNTVGYLINPDYYALRQVLDALK